MRAAVIGGGLAGCEAAWALANAGIEVTLYEMKPLKKTPAHRYDGLAELVCSNSLKAIRHNSAAGLLKEEMRRCGSLILACADGAAVPAGGALAVDRFRFSNLVTKHMDAHPRIRRVSAVVSQIPEEPCVIATGPLTDAALSGEIERLCGSRLSFFDAAAPIVSFESLDREKIFFAARYGKGDPDYINCPMDEAQYRAFHTALTGAERAPLHEADRAFFRVYEGCMPIEVLAGRGEDTMRFGPLKPVGLTDPRTGQRPYAVVQLRREDREGRLYNLVGFQTNLRFPEQKRVFSMIPGLEQAEFIRYGVMHRNFFLNSPQLLNPDYSMKSRPTLFFAGQMTGVEGYIESAASGILAGLNLARRLNGMKPLILPAETMMGALARHVSTSPAADFQPMGCNMGILPPLAERVKGKPEKYQAYADRAERALTAYLEQICAVEGRNPVQPVQL